MNKRPIPRYQHTPTGIAGALLVASLVVMFSAASRAGPVPTPPAGWREGVETPATSKNPDEDSAGERDSSAPVPTPPAARQPASEAPTVPAGPATPYAPDERDC